MVIKEPMRMFYVDMPPISTDGTPMVFTAKQREFIKIRFEGNDEVNIVHNDWDIEIRAIRNSKIYGENKTYIVFVNFKKRVDNRSIALISDSCLFPTKMFLGVNTSHNSILDYRIVRKILKRKGRIKNV